MIEDHCDQCRRPFGRIANALAICPTCGIENVRVDKPKATVAETAMIATPERATLSVPLARIVPSLAKKQNKRKRF